MDALTQIRYDCDPNFRRVVDSLTLFVRNCSLTPELLQSACEMVDANVKMHGVRCAIPIEETIQVSDRNHPRHGHFGVVIKIHTQQIDMVDIEFDGPVIEQLSILQITRPWS